VDNKTDRLWSTAKELLKNELTEVSYKTWIEPLVVLSMEENTLLLSVPNNFMKGLLETRYSTYITEALRKVSSRPVDVSFVLPDQAEKLSRPPDSRNESASAGLIPKYTFDTFVIGNSNRFAHAAALAVAEAPSNAYNPLFIYGGVGLGKTHLMHAIGHFILSQNPSTRVLYISSEKFTNDLINAIMNQKTVSFKNRYRNIDVLLIDDIQFIAGKEQTQEELFHTFNALHQSDKQIILSSDSPPKEIPKLEERLRSRFEWGLIADIQPPDLETRIAILRKKAESENIQVADDILTYIANQIESNIRELEGALTRLLAYVSLTGEDLSMDLATSVLQQLTSTTSLKKLTIPIIKKLVGNYFDKTLEELDSKKRDRSLSLPRQIAMYLSRIHTDSSLPMIGREFGGRDHTTVIHAYEKINEALKNDIQLQKQIKDLEELLVNQ